MTLGQSTHDRLPHLPSASDPVHEHEWLAAAAAVVVEPHWPKLPQNVGGGIGLMSKMDKPGCRLSPWRPIERSSAGHYLCTNRPSPFRRRSMASTQETGTERGTLQELARRHLWMHFTRMSAYDDHEIPIIVRGEGCY